MVSSFLSHGDSGTADSGARTYRTHGISPGPSDLSHPLLSRLSRATPLATLHHPLKPACGRSLRSVAWRARPPRPRCHADGQPAWRPSWTCWTEEFHPQRQQLPLAVATNAAGARSRLVLMLVVTCGCGMQSCNRWLFWYQAADAATADSKSTYSVNSVVSSCMADRRAALRRLSSLSPALIRASSVALPIAGA